MQDQRSASSFLSSDDDVLLADMNALTGVPSGAFALAGIAVGLLVIAWLAIYFFVFLARGPVG